MPNEADDTKEYLGEEMPAELADFLEQNAIRISNTAKTSKAENPETLVVHLSDGLFRQLKSGTDQHLKRFTDDFKIVDSNSLRQKFNEAILKILREIPDIETKKDGHTETKWAETDCKKRDLVRKFFKALEARGGSNQALSIMYKEKRIQVDGKWLDIEALFKTWAVEATQAKNIGTTDTRPASYREILDYMHLIATGQKQKAVEAREMRHAFLRSKPAALAFMQNICDLPEPPDLESQEGRALWIDIYRGLPLKWNLHSPKWTKTQFGAPDGNGRIVEIKALEFIKVWQKDTLSYGLTILLDTICGELFGFSVSQMIREAQEEAAKQRKLGEEKGGAEEPIIPKGRPWLKSDLQDPVTVKMIVADLLNLKNPRWDDSIIQAMLITYLIPDFKKQRVIRIPGMQPLFTGQLLEAWGVSPLHAWMEILEKVFLIEEPLEQKVKATGSWSLRRRYAQDLMKAAGWKTPKLEKDAEVPKNV